MNFVLLFLPLFSYTMVLRYHSGQCLGNHMWYQRLNNLCDDRDWTWAGIVQSKRFSLCIIFLAPFASYLMEASENVNSYWAGLDAAAGFPHTGESPRQTQESFLWSWGMEYNQGIQYGYGIQYNPWATKASTVLSHPGWWKAYLSSAQGTPSSWFLLWFWYWLYKSIQKASLTFLDIGQ